jgi:hypothetical protein
MRPDQISGSTSIVPPLEVVWARGVAIETLCFFDLQHFARNRRVAGCPPRQLRPSNPPSPPRQLGLAHFVEGPRELNRARLL